MFGLIGDGILIYNQSWNFYFFQVTTGETSAGTSDEGRRKSWLLF